MYIKYEDLDNVEKIKEILISLGIKEELLNHKAFNVVLKVIREKSLRYGKQERTPTMTEPRIDIDGSIKCITFESYDHLFRLLLFLDGNKLVLNSYEAVEDGTLTLSRKIEFSTIENGSLDIREISGTTSKKDIMGNIQKLAITLIKRRFNSDGIEEIQQYYMTDNIERKCSVGRLTPQTTCDTYGYEANIETRLNVSPEKVNKKLYRRDDVDIVSAYFVEDGKESEFYDQINNERGLQEITPTNFQGRNNYPIEPLTTEQFERLIKHCNSSEMQEALLRRYSDQRTKITYQKEDHSRGTPRR